MVRDQARATGAQRLLAVFLPGALALILATGCSSVAEPSPDLMKEVSRTVASASADQAGATSPVGSATKAFAGSVLLSPLAQISGGWKATAQAPNAPSRRENLRRPIGLGVSGNDLFIAEAGYAQLLRYELGGDRLSSLIDLPSLGARASVGVAMSADRTIYIADPVGRRILHLREDGALIRAIADTRLLAEPVDVALDQFNTLFIADGLQAHVLIVSALGQPLRVIDSSSGGPDSVCCVSVSSGMLYIADPVGRQVIQIRLDSGERRVIELGQDSLVSAITTDDEGRLFVGDGRSGSIRVFDNQGRELSVNTSARLPVITQLTALAVEGPLLYVVDGGAGQIYSFVAAVESARQGR